MTKMGPMPVFLLTDFGTRDSFVGEMKAVIAGIAPEVPVYDITHEIEPFAVDEAAWTLGNVLVHLPRRAVVLAVVDPGVGTERRAVVVKVGGRLLVGPDDGLFSATLDDDGGLGRFVRVREIDARRAGIERVSRTFHGRDLFAPVAARLASGELRFRDVGPKRAALESLPRPIATHVKDGCGEGYVVHIDRFGNAITTVRGVGVPPCAVLHAGDRSISDRVSTFAEIPAGRVAWYVDSSGYVGLAANQASAAAMLGLRRGDPVRVTG